LVVDNAKVTVGSPYVKGAKVRATVLEQIKAPKIIVYKYIPKERYRRKYGHRQRYTKLAIDKITVTAPRRKTTTAKESDETAKKPARKPKTTTAKATTARKPRSTKTTGESKTKSAPKKTTRKPRASKSSTTTGDKTPDKG
jgi:large subunit ribosomal protein L21